MATAGTQTSGSASEVAYSTVPTAGYYGWSPQDATGRTVHQVTGGNYRGAYANSTAYAIGDVVSYNGATYRAKSAVSSSNSTPPALGSVWSDATNHRGLAESVTTSHVQYYR